MAITLNTKKQIPLSSIASVQTHSDISLLVRTTTGEQYFASMVENDQTNGVATLEPVIEPAYDLEDEEDDDFFEDDFGEYDYEDELLP